MTQNTKNYPGRLGVPRPAHSLLSQPYPEESELQGVSDTVRSILAPFIDGIREAHIRRAEQDLEGLKLLMGHFGIATNDPRKWFWLALHLAERHVPGFMYEKSPRGRPKKWGPVEQHELIEHIGQVMRDRPHLSEKDACRILVNRGLYEQMADSLYKRYSEAKAKQSG